MVLRICTKCGVEFEPDGTKVCPACALLVEEAPKIEAPKVAVKITPKVTTITKK